MKVMQPDSLRSFACAGAALLLSCGNAIERSIIRADGEIFESVVRSQLPDSWKLLPRTMSPLRFDARPAGDNADLAATPDRPRQLDLTAPPHSFPRDPLNSIVGQRKDIINPTGRDARRPFSYPQCAGAPLRGS